MPKYACSVARAAPRRPNRKYTALAATLPATNHSRCLEPAITPPAYDWRSSGPVAKEQALLSQLFVMDNKTPVADVVAKAAKDAGASITLKNYVRFQLGEGIEKEESDFAAEVAAAVAG